MYIYILLSASHQVSFAKSAQRAIDCGKSALSRRTRAAHEWHCQPRQAQLPLKMCLPLRMHASAVPAHEHHQNWVVGRPQCLRKSGCKNT